MSETQQVDAAAVLRLARERGYTIATAESLTGGLVGATLTAVAGCSHVYRGGIVAYQRQVKQSLLGVSAQRLDERGAVDPVVAEQMALGCAQALDADVGIATTGVAGPGPSEGKPAGTVYVAAVGPAGGVNQRYEFVGDRLQVRAASVAAALRLAAQVMQMEQS